MVQFCSKLDCDGPVGGLKLDYTENNPCGFGVVQVRPRCNLVGSGWGSVLCLGFGPLRLASDMTRADDKSDRYDLSTNRHIAMNNTAL